MSEKTKKVVRKAKPKEPEEETIASIGPAMPILEEPITEKEPEPVEETPLSLDDRLLAYIKGLKEPFNIHKATVYLGVENSDLIKQAWDRLYDKHLVPYINIR